MLKYSVIVPVYNSEKYIGECIKSVLEQSEPALELIIIDDGSHDDSLGIIREFKKRDPRIEVEITLHVGPGKARNIGLKKAKGEYVVFLDSDDYWDREYLKKLTEVINDIKPDICFGNQHNDLFGDRVETIFYYDSTACNNLVSKDDKIAFFFRKGNRYPGSTWNNVYRREFIISNKVAFHEKYLFGEDTDFMFQALEKAHTIVSHNINFYYYRKASETSLTNTMSYWKLSQRLEILRKWYFYYLKELREREQVSVICDKLVDEYFNVFLLVDMIQQKDGRKEFLKRIHTDREIWQKASGKKQKAVILIMKLFGEEIGIAVLNKYNRLRMKI